MECAASRVLSELSEGWRLPAWAWAKTVLSWVRSASEGWKREGAGADAGGADSCARASVEKVAMDATEALRSRIENGEQ